uniref:Uncharacterized protein n=1 Tax=Anguilla anguilla TaxID=7936 RepID=A0A0E9XA39_ANGAN
MDEKRSLCIHCAKSFNTKYSLGAKSDRCTQCGKGFFMNSAPKNSYSSKVFFN